MKLLKAKIATYTVTGKAGKSATMNTLLAPRVELPDNTIFRVESIHESGKAIGFKEKKYTGDQIEIIMRDLSKLDSFLFDIGTSNVETFGHALTQRVGSHRMFDFFVVPIKAVKEDNEFKEFVQSIETLHALGVEPNRIKVVFTRHPVGKDIESTMARVFNYHKKHPIFTLNPKAVIHETPAYQALEGSPKGYADLLADDTDYWAMLDATPLDKTADREALVKAAGAQAYIKGLHAELNEVFSELFGVPSADKKSVTKAVAPAARSASADISQFE